MDAETVTCSNLHSFWCKASSFFYFLSPYLSVTQRYNCQCQLSNNIQRFVLHIKPFIFIANPSCETSFCAGDFSRTLEHERAYKQNTFERTHHISVVTLPASCWTEYRLRSPLPPRSDTLPLSLLSAARSPLELKSAAPSPPTDGGGEGGSLAVKLHWQTFVKLKLAKTHLIL